MLLVVKRLLNMVTKSMLTGELAQIKVSNGEFTNDVLNRKECTFFAWKDMYSSIVIDELDKQNDSWKLKFAKTGCIVDMYTDPSRQDKLVLIYKNNVNSKSTTRLEFQDPNTRLDIDGTTIYEDSKVEVIYEYELSKYNGLKKYKFKSTDILDITLHNGRHVLGLIDTRLMFRRKTDDLSVFSYSSLPFEQIVDNKDYIEVDRVCIDLGDILKIQACEKVYGNDDSLKKPVEE